MIIDFSIKAKPSSKKANCTFTVCIVLAFVFFAASGFVSLYNGLVGLVGLIFLTAALTVYTKYISPMYYYDVFTDSDGTPLFIVRQVVGKRETTLCRIGLCEVMKLEREDRATRRKHKTPSDHQKFSYLPTLDPTVSYRMTTRSRYERAEILLEISDEMAQMIKNYAEIARATAIDE